MTDSRQPDAPDPLAVVMGRIEAASVLAATVLPDLVRHYEMGFVGEAYTAAHECAELVLKMHLGNLGTDVPRGRQGHDLPGLFRLWGDDRDGAELAYQRRVVGSTVQSRLADATRKALRLDDFPYMSEIERPSIEQVNRASAELEHAILRAGDPLVGSVMGRLDSILGPKDVRTLCTPVRQERLVEARYPPAVWYPEKLLELRWQELTEATRESTSLGIVEWFLAKEGTPEVYVAWKYLHEGNLAKLGHQFRGPAVKMISIAKCLKNFATSAREA